MTLDLTDEQVATIAKALKYAIRHEQEAVASGEPDHAAIAELSGCYTMLSQKVAHTLHNDFIVRRRRIFREDADY